VIFVQNIEFSIKNSLITLILFTKILPIFFEMLFEHFSLLLKPNSYAVMLWLKTIDLIHELPSIIYQLFYVSKEMLIVLHVIQYVILY